MNRLPCLLCGHESHEVRMGLVSWRDPVGEKYAAIPRCTDRAACRVRVEANGDEWDVEDPAPRSTLELVR